MTLNFDIINLTVVELEKKSVDVIEFGYFMLSKNNCLANYSMALKIGFESMRPLPIGFQFLCHQRLEHFIPVNIHKPMDTKNNDTL